MHGLLISISSFFRQNADDMVHSLSEMYPNADSAQINAWRTLLCDIANSPTARCLPDDCLLGIEYSLPTDGMAVDFFIAGHDSCGKRVVFFVEAKQWNDQYIKKTTFAFHRNPDTELHPQVQVLRHKLSFTGYLDIGPTFETIPCVFIRNCSTGGLQQLAESNMDPCSKSIEIYRDINVLFNVINQKITSGISDGIELFSCAEYIPSRSIIDAMSSIITKEPPFILTPEQENITNEIRKNIDNGKKIIRISGAAGSGKTAVLLNLYVDLLNNMSSNEIPIFVSGAQNTAYYQSKYPEVRNSFTYSYSLDKMVRPKSKTKKIILMDEAQHNQAGIISSMIERGVTLVLCYDTAQIINADNALAELKSLELREDFVTLELNNSVRFNGSCVAERNIKMCLNGQNNFFSDDKFDFRLLHSQEDFQKMVLSVMAEHPEQTVAVTGLLSSDADNFTIKGNPESLFFTDWSSPGKWEKAECRWMPYVTGKKYLSQYEGKIWVGTWWMPGLDVDYIFVIVGGDAKMTSCGLIANPDCAKHFRMMNSIAEELNFPRSIFSKKAYLTAQHIREFIQKPENAVLKKLFLQRFTELLRNNYYIMMSRGRKGCYVFFTNNEND